MTEDQALAKMIPPNQKRIMATGRMKQQGGVIQIWITRACDLACFNCTQASNLGGNPGKITLDQFEQACISLKDYFGVVGIFGGNPCVHPQFEEMCTILRKYIPKSRCGLWSNNPMGKGKICRETFNPGASNLNVHLSQKAYDEFKRDWPECKPIGLKEDSRHSPVHLAMKDVIADESERWDKISNCDINKYWSAMIGVFRGELRGWFCEIAGAQSMFQQDKPNYPDTGIPIPTPGDKQWWEYGMNYYKHQVKKHCHECAVPLRGYGELACSTNGVEQTSKTYADLYKPKRKGREVQIVTTLEELQHQVTRTTDYLQNSRI